MLRMSRLAIWKPLLGVGLSLLYPFSLTAQSSMTVRGEEHHDVSQPLRDLIRVAPPQPRAVREAEPVRRIPLPPGLTTLPEDPVRQSTATSLAAFAPVVSLGFEGLGAGQVQVVQGFSSVPPDTNGAVGSTQYVQWVNVSFAIFNKSTGALIAGPTPGKTLWSGFGGGCETNNDGDPIVLYDKLANRWVFSQFSISTTPFLQCIAVSTTEDATGTYNRYSFQYSNFDDYPKMGVWPDAYYETFNMFDTHNNFVGADACAYDRNAMLNGTPATQVCFQQSSSIGGLLPADLDGTTPPPAGSPNYMLDFDTNSLNLFKFHVDFATPANSSFLGPTVIPVAAFSPLCGGGTCVPQPGTSTQLDSLADRLMYRLAYRNFGTHESLVVNHSVATSSGSSGGVRWYEIQNPGGTPTVAQQGTFAPDSSYRWMGSIAMDNAGDIAVGYSVSDATSVFPSIAFTGRVSTDPSGTLQAETSIFSGTGSQTTDPMGRQVTRWGDYSAMQVDPADDCTFWYTNEYLKTNGSFNWNTRIASFKFPNCTTFPLSIVLAGTGSGTVASTPAGINCPGTCSANFASGTMVTLTAAPAAGSTFAGWSGACSGTGSCSVTMNSAQAVTATFNVVTFALSVTQAGAGSGSVTSAPAGINCPGTCSANFASGTVVNLTATPAAGSTFAGWSGACSGGGACSISMTAAESVTGTFRVTTTTALTVSSAQANAGSSVTFTAKVSAASGATAPTGTVTFNNGPTLLGTAQLSNGTATLTTSALASGSYSVTASYGGDTNSGSSSSAPVTLMVVDFTVVPGQSSLTVTRGHSVQTSLAVTPAPLAGFNPTVTFACSGLPLESTCSFNPPSLTPNGATVTTTLTIQTTAPSARLERLFGRGGLLYALILPGFLGILVAKRSSKQVPGTFRLLCLVGTLILSTMWWTGCGAANGSGSGGTSNPGTPVGSSAITITSTSSGTSPISKQVTIALTVQ
jgi:Bacterial Ig-like domain (group 3)/Divergent InlB B-repeat domain